MAGTERALKIVDDWKLFWFKQDDYRERALRVDANMRHHLADLIESAIKEAEAQVLVQWNESCYQRGYEDGSADARK